MPGAAAFNRSRHQANVWQKLKKKLFHAHLLHVSDYNHLNAFIYHFVSNERQRNIFGMNEN